MADPEIAEGVAVNYPGTGPVHDAGRSHICVVIHVDTATRDVLLVPVCSFHDRCDKTCVLEPIDGWREIKKRSFMGYYQIKKVPLRAMQIRIQSGEITYLGQVPPMLYGKIRAGVTSSPETEARILRTLPPRRS